MAVPHIFDIDIHKMIQSHSFKKSNNKRLKCVEKLNHVSPLIQAAA